MSNRTFTLDDSLYDYLLSISLREPEILRRLRQETSNDPMARMQIAPEQGQFMALLARLMGAKKCLEIGVYTGYSSLSIALALPPDGKLIACDNNIQWTMIAQRYWNEANVAEKIELRIAPALDTLDTLFAENQQNSFDFVFIDADKGNYVNYYERSLELLRPGGLILIDNTLWSGRVADPANDERETEKIRNFNRVLYSDERIRLSLVPIGDGLTLAQKIKN